MVGAFSVMLIDQVADPLQFAVDLGRRQEEAQVDRHRLLGGDEGQDHLVDLDLEAVEFLLVLGDALGDGLVAFDQLADGLVDHGLGDGGHVDELLLQFVQFLVELPLDGCPCRPPSRIGR